MIAFLLVSAIVILVCLIWFQERPTKYYYCVVKGRTQFIAYAKREPFMTDDPSMLFELEPGELWFGLGDTAEEALSKLKASLGQD